MENDLDKRFSGVLGEEYQLFKMSVPHHDELQDKITDTLKDLMSLSSHKIEVLEAGTGTGLTTLRILDAGENIKITTVDNEEKILNQAKKVLQEESSRITFVLDDILDFLKQSSENSFDAFVSAYVIHNFKPDYREELFKEIYRVLKPDGIFINADKYAYDDEELQKQALNEQIKLFNIYDGLGRQDLKEEWTKHYLEDEKVKITEIEQVNILNNLGFKNSKVIYRKGMEAVIVGFK